MFSADGIPPEVCCVLDWLRIMGGWVLRVAPGCKVSEFLASSVMSLFVVMLVGSVAGVVGVDGLLLSVLLFFMLLFTVSLWMVGM